MGHVSDAIKTFRAFDKALQNGRPRGRVVVTLFVLLCKSFYLDLIKPITIEYAMLTKPNISPTTLLTPCTEDEMCHP